MQLEPSSSLFSEIGRRLLAEMWRSEKEGEWMKLSPREQEMRVIWGNKMIVKPHIWAYLMLSNVT